MLIERGDSYEEICDKFQWKVPEKFNIATYVCDRWADDESRVALIYEDENQIYESIRWENLGDGQEDYEMFWLLNATLEEIETYSLLSQSEINGYKNELNTIIDNVADDFLDYTDNPHDIYNGIERIGNILHRLSSVIDIQSIGETPWFPISGISP